MTKFFFALLIIHCQLSIVNCYAQPGALDTTFHTQLAANTYINSIVIQADEKIVVGGNFTTYQSFPCNHIARINQDGSFDTSFTANTNANVNHVTIQPDGKILIGGDFGIVNGDTLRGIARLLSNGNTDTTFHVGSGFNNKTNCITIQPDGKILVSGLFTSYNNTAANYLIRLNSDGSIDNSFNTTNAPNGEVMTIELQPDGKILIGGSFTAIGPTFPPNGRIARLNSNGTIDAAFTANTQVGASSFITDIALMPDNSIIIVGALNSFNFVPVGKMARLTEIGTLDANFPFSGGADDNLNAVLTTGEGAIFVGGNFQNFQDAPFQYPLSRIAKLNQYGSVDTLFHIGTGASLNIHEMQLQADGRLIIVGAFNSYNDVPRQYIARLYNCLTPSPTLIQGPDSILCSTTATYTVPAVPEAQSYEWTLPQGWTGSTTTNSITVQTGGSGVVSVRAFSDSCGWSNPSTKTIYQTQIPAPEICLVTVDSASTHNIIMWEKNPPTTLIDSFFVYRETSTNVYTKIAAVPYDSLSQYHDYGANPNVTNYRYRLSALSTCGTETPRSPYHSTIHLQDQNNGNFNWTFYQIEGQPNPVINYKFYKDDLDDGNFQLTGFISGNSNQYTDPAFAAYDSSAYFVDVEWAIGCTPTRTLNTTRGNIRHKNSFVGPIDTTGITETAAALLAIFPNPAEDAFYIQSPFPIKAIKMLNVLGQELNCPSNKQKVTVAHLAKGVYTLIVEIGDSRVVRKVVVE